jgi:hypothetical protein
VIDEVTTMRPRPDASSAGRQAWTAKIVPLRLVPRTSSRSSPVMSTSFAEGKIPALAQSTSMPPWRSTAAAAITSHWSRLDTSATSDDTSPPRVVSSSTAAASVVS